MSFTGSEGLGEGYDGDIAFASALEAFGGGHNDPISVAFGGMLVFVFTVLMAFWFLSVLCQDGPYPTFLSLFANYMSSLQYTLTSQIKYYK